MGTGPFVFPDPFDLGGCSFGGCGGKTVGCVDDGVCGPDDDCVCADCASDAYCNPSSMFCPTNGACEPYYEGCSCADCAAHPMCQ